MKSITLKQWLLNEKGKAGVQWLAEELDITPQAVYEQLRKEEIGHSFMHKLDKAGLTIHINQGKKQEVFKDPEKELLAVYRELNQVKKELEEARINIRDLEDEIKIQETRNYELKTELAAYKKNLA